MIGKFEVTQSAHSTFMFHLRADNGSVILVGPAHATKDDALAAIDEARRSAAVPERFERLEQPPGKVCFVLTSPGGDVLGYSQAYASKSALENGIASVARNGAEAVLVDMACERRRVVARQVG